VCSSQYMKENVCVGIKLFMSSFIKGGGGGGKAAAHQQVSCKEKKLQPAKVTQM